MKDRVKMTKGRAIALIVSVPFAVFVGVCVILGAVHADGTAFGLAMIVIGGTSAYGCSEVVMHYSDSPPRRRRR